MMNSNSLISPKSIVLVALVCAVFGLTAYGQCPTVTPTVSDTCFIGTQDVSLYASGSSNLYAVYDAATGGNFFGNGSSPVDAGVVNATTTFYLAAQEQNYALDFDGNNDYVAVQNYVYNTSGMTGLTVEAWVRTTSTSAMIIASFDRSEYWRLGVGSTGATSGRVSWNVRTNAGFLDMGGSTAVNDGQWHHVAGTFNAGTARIYVDGVLDATSSLGATWGSGATRYGFIGTGSEASSFNGNRGPNSHMNGEVDELRVWSTAKTAVDLVNNMNNCLLGTESNLEMYYKLNDGTGANLVSDQVSTSNGTLVNMNANSDWTLRDAVYSCPSCESARVPLIVTIDNSSPLSISGGSVPSSCSGVYPTLDAGTGYSAYLWNTGASTQTISVSTSGTYTVEVQNAGCVAKDSVVVNLEGGNAQTSGLFDGVNDRAAINGLFYNSNSISELSVEAWVKTTNSGDQIIASFDRSEYWRLGINGDGAAAGRVAWNLNTSAGILDFGSSTRVDDGNWHHIVGTYNAGVARIYIDGVLDATANQGVSIGSGTIRYGFIGTGSEASGYNGSRGPNWLFDGEVEELKIWSRELSAVEIRTNMCKNYLGTDPDLQAYFKFNEGFGTNIQSVVGAVSAQTVSVNQNTFWSNSGAPVGDNSMHLYPTSWTGVSSSIISCSGATLTISDVVGTADGVHLYVLEGDPDNTNGIDGFLIGNHYYGIFWPKSASVNYSATLDYTSHPLVNVGSEFGLNTLVRTDKTANTFVRENTANNTITKQITASLNGRKEIILDSFFYTWTGATNTNWAAASNWSTTSVPPINANVLIPDVVNQPVLNSDKILGNFKLETNASVDLNGHKLEIVANLEAEGTINSNAGEILFSGTLPQDFIAGVNQTLDNITTTNPTTVALKEQEVELKNTLVVQNGTFDTNDSLVLISDATGTARIGEITGGGLIVGEIEMQRYIDAGETYWRLFSSAVEGATVEDYQGDFITSGYVGSDFPNFPFTSVYTYTEGTGYVAVSNASQVINPGQGLMVWSGDTITGTDPFVVDYRGIPNQGDINVPLTFSPTDGWNLVGNPYASTINWDLINGSDKQNIADAIYILNPDTEQYATYVNGAGANGGSNLIPSQQAFWVGAVASNPSLLIRESVKSSVDQPFFKSGTAISSGMHILISGNGMTDEAVVRHVEGTSDAYESNFDAAKRFATWAGYPHISILNQDALDLTVHSFDKQFQEWSMPLRAIVFQDGVYDIVFNDIHELNVPCLKLEDTYSGQIYPIEEGVPLSFAMSDTTYAPRFILHIGKNYETHTTDPLCAGEPGMLTVVVDSNETGIFEINNINLVETGAYSGHFTLDSIYAGTYTLVLSGGGNLCQVSQFDFEINEPAPINVQSAIIPETTGQDGEIQLNVSGGVPDYSFLWSNGATDSVITGLTAGVYVVEIQDANGCTREEQYEINSVLAVSNHDILQTEMKYFISESRIQLSGVLEQTYKLLDINGREIRSYSVDKGQTLANFILPNTLAKGTYVLTGFDNSYTIIK